ncbi:UNVERIFIED_CONTAM: hypothetical protein RMT77_010364 [Armadillidium vulgare]
MGKHLQTKGAVACMKTLLMIFNALFLVLGCIFLTAGVLVTLELHKYVNMSVEFSSATPFVSLGAGGFMLILGILAVCCTAKGQPVLVYIYAAFLLVVLVILLGAGVSGWAYRGRLKTSYEEGLARAFTEYGRSSEKNSSVDSLQRTLRCCGIHNASDWVAMPFGQTHEPPFPLSCCREFHENVCMLYSQGCYSVVISFMESQWIIFMGCAVGLAGFQLFGVFIACCLARNLHRAHYEEV